MSKSEPQNSPNRNEILRQALLRLIEIYVPKVFQSEREMAESLGIIPAHFSQMKNGHRNIGKEAASRIEKGLDLGLGGLYLLADTKEEKTPSLTHTISSRYKMSKKAVKALVDLTLSSKSPPKWATKSILLQHKALLEAIDETINSDKK